MIEINNDKIQKLTIRRHASASKVIFRHPICIVRAFDFELIRIISVAENMDEKKTSFGFEPFWDFFEKTIVVFHVLEHFVCHDSVEFYLLKKDENFVEGGSNLSTFVENVCNVDVACNWSNSFFISSFSSFISDVLLNFEKFGRKLTIVDWPVAFSS